MAYGVGGSPEHNGRAGPGGTKIAHQRAILPDPRPEPCAGDDGVEDDDGGNPEDDQRPVVCMVVGVR